MGSLTAVGFVATPLGELAAGVFVGAAAVLLLGMLLSAVASNNQASPSKQCGCEFEPASGNQSSSAAFSALIDPSGTVFSADGVPIPGATAVLEKAPTPEGPFSLVDAASPGVQPHLNPEKTNQDGQFHWDVISDYYKVVASAPGCHAPGNPAQATVSTPALAVPPPQVGLDLVLQCAHQAAPPRPLVTSLSSGESLEKGGGQIEIVGRHFTPSATVRFGGAPALSVTFESPELVLASVPPGKGTVNVVVTTEGGTSSAAAAARLVYASAPAISKVSPPSGPPAGGTTVTIFGTGLDNTEVVRVGRAYATNFAVKSDQEIELTVPPGTRGAVDVIVTTPVGQSAVSRADRFTYRPARAIRTYPPRS